MIKSFFSKKRGKPAPQPVIPAGMRVYAIGDVHGRYDLLIKLMEMIDKDDATRGVTETQLIFLGDLVDRGPDSKNVVEYCRELAQQSDKVRFLTGNHEEVMLGAATGKPALVRFFCRIGGRETILSYGMPLTRYRSLELEELSEIMSDMFPRDHIEFIAGFEDQITIGDYVFVHAGIRPKIPLTEQSQKDLRWIREDFIAHDQPHEKFVIHGHTISENVDEQKNRIGVDTGAYLTDRLTAIGLEGNERWFLQTVPAI